jgi:hypothetical protein
MEMCGSEITANLILSKAKLGLKNERTSKITPAMIKGLVFFIKNLPLSLIAELNPCLRQAAEIRNLQSEFNLLPYLQFSFSHILFF